MMDLALELSLNGIGKVNPNPLVGAVVVKDGCIVGKGFHPMYKQPHAEVFAIREAGEQARGADIYVTLEPCSHFGNTPPCADLLIEAGVARCFIAILDPNPLVAGNGVRKLQAAGIEVFVGLCADEAWRINRVFLKYITTKIPFVFLKYGSTLDGKIAASSKRGEKITNQAVWERVHRYRNEFAGILVGINTLIGDNPRLDCRLEGGRNPHRFVIDPNFKTDSSMNFVVNNSDCRSVVITSVDFKDSVKFSFLKEKYNVEFILLEGRKFDFLEILKKIGEMKVDSLLVEGGGAVISQILKEGLFDAGEIFIAPVVLGDDSAVACCSGRECLSVADGIALPNVKVNCYGDNAGFEFEK
ncbi:MAG: bifunctional diaminohydroxyphosphoribosylaminopyrimidine deaminase/5-amino-6-(5-phosphoribosylamino)uracil reductase RibD [Spirochaetales bacterium]|nr:bifunctional diaminohydroxyphosphoribosylaminopyrimidine deaminase/5-amino-6-(5-phosphoribosylamino)uracil reductase RibD [Spirochaetales bacterium]